jgi:hypothetical protein
MSVCVYVCERMGFPRIDDQLSEYGDMVDIFPPQDVVVGRLFSSDEIPPAVKLNVVRSNPFDRSCLVWNTSWPICMQTMMMTIAGYML